MADNHQPSATPEEINDAIRETAAGITRQFQAMLEDVVKQAKSQVVLPENANKRAVVDAHMVFRDFVIAKLANIEVHLVSVIGEKDQLKQHIDKLDSEYAILEERIEELEQHRP